MADPLEHGGRRDVSIALALSSDAEKIPRPPLLGAPENYFKRLRVRLAQRREGYWGSAPMDGSREEGEQLLEEQADLLVARLRRVLEGGEDPDRVFRSGYSYFLPNHSMFYGWLWSIGMTIAILSWVTLSVQLLLSR